MSEALIWLLIGLLICGTILGAGYQTFTHEEKMASLGYIEVQSLGTSDTLWVKP